MRFLIALALAPLLACRGEGDSLGRLESYLLLAPQGPPSVQGVQVRRRIHRCWCTPLAVGEEPALTLGRVLNDGFASEMVRTVHLAKQLVRQERAPAAARATPMRSAPPRPSRCAWWWAATSAAEQSRGLAFERWGRARRSSPHCAGWGCRRNIEGDKALVQTVTGRLAAHAAAGSRAGPRPGLRRRWSMRYRMAMEVIAREWRAGTGIGQRVAQHRRHHGAAAPVRAGPGKRRRAGPRTARTCDPRPSCWPIPASPPP